jgi:hypothetical protein
LQVTLADALDVNNDHALATETVRKLRFIDKALEEVDSALEKLEP